MQAEGRKAHGRRDLALALARRHTGGVVEYPRVTIGAAGDEAGGGARLAHELAGAPGAHNVTRGDNGHVNRSHDLTDEPGVGLPAIHLRGNAPVDGDGRRTRVFHRAREVGPHDRIGLAAHADLHRHRHLKLIAQHAHDGGGALGIIEQGGAGAALSNLGHWTSHVHVDEGELVTHTLGNLGGRLAKVVDV